MHILQPKHIKLSHAESEKLVSALNISLTQLPKIHVNDPALPEGCEIGNIIKIERKSEDGKTTVYYRVVAV
jgi:DNA-directed RNA polymerase subunit H (RpoH/RPB5)